MREIPRFVLTEVYDIIGAKTKQKMVKHLYGNEENAEMMFDHYLKSLIASTFFIENDVVDIAEIQNNYHRKRQLTKKNWLKALQKDLAENKVTPIHQEIEVLEKLMERNVDEKDVMSLFSIQSPQELLDVRLRELEAWANSKTSRITDYPYLETKLRYQLEKAFETDIIYLVSEFLKSNPRNWISRYPKEELENPYPLFTPDHTLMKGNLRIDPVTKANELFEEHPLPDGRHLIYKIVQSKPEEGEKITIDKVSFLDGKDNEIIQYLMNNLDERFLSEKMVVVDLGELVEVAYGSKSNKAYSLVKDRVKKIAKFYFEGKVVRPDNNTVNEFVFNFFQSAEIKTDPATDKSYVEIIFSDRIHHQLINNHTVNIYSHLITKLENKISKLLVFSFQKERIDAHLQGRDMRKTFDYNYFATRIRFRSKRIETNMKLIEESLQEFKRLNILIEDYVRVGNSFQITLFPITEDEQVDLFPSPSTNLLKG